MAEFLTDLIVVCQLLNHVSAFSFLPKGRTIHFDRFDGTCKGKKLPMTINYVIQDIGKHIYDINGTLRITEDIDGNQRFSLEKCRSKENLDTCEDFVKRDTNYCDGVNPKNKFLPMYIEYTPQHKCPIKRGVYKFSKKVDMSKVVVFPLDGWYWKAKNEIVDTKANRLLHCAIFEAYIL